MGRLSFWPAILGIALAMMVVTLIEPVIHSMAYAAGVVVIIGLLGWVLEARAVAGPPPAVEPEHEEEEDAPGPSYWPIVLSLGIVGIAAGLVYEWEYGALVVALPLAAWAAAAWAQVVKGEQEAVAEHELEPTSRPLVTASGATLLPVQPNVLVAQSAGGAAIAIERTQTKEISRRGLLAITFWTGLGAGLLAFAGMLVDFLYPRGITGFGSVILAGNVSDYAPGTKTPNAQGKFWMVNLTEEQGGPGFLALWWKCPHLGCTVPWRETFSFVDPASGANKQGWFRCPCHGSTYNDAGVRVFGPAPRSMDRMELTIDGSGNISVNTGAITKGTPDNNAFAVQG
jgi:cytochrome b6-f complex iron-sulfur subunit